MIKVKFISVFISNQKKRKKIKKTQIKMITLNKVKIMFRNRKKRNFISSKIFTLIKYNQLNKVNKFIKTNNHINCYKNYKINFLSQKLATSLFRNSSIHKI